MDFYFMDKAEIAFLADYLKLKSQHSNRLFIDIDFYWMLNKRHQIDMQSIEHYIIKTQQ